ncbi:hypothetical protein BC830DRAFT_1154798 [Chytriomyces sp. MP71]|nr:hypothetical protein BC830DRAFT_1154798 [Chytriomyces sp. MP71]
MFLVILSLSFHVTSEGLNRRMLCWWCYCLFWFSTRGSPHVTQTKNAQTTDNREMDQAPASKKLEVQKLRSRRVMALQQLAQKRRSDRIARATQEEPVHRFGTRSRARRQLPASIKLENSGLLPSPVSPSVSTLSHQPPSDATNGSMGRYSTPHHQTPIQSPPSSDLNLDLLLFGTPADDPFAFLDLPPLPPPTSHATSNLPDCENAANINNLDPPPTKKNRATKPKAIRPRILRPKRTDRTNADLKQHTCPLCAAALVSSSHLARHMRTHTGLKPYQCGVLGCERRFARKDNCRQHTEKHEEALEAGTSRKYKRDVGDSEVLDEPKVALEFWKKARSDVVT